MVTRGLGGQQPAGTTYVLWGMQQGNPVPSARSTSSGRTGHAERGHRPTGLDHYAGYGVSLEPGRQAPAEPSHIVANGQVNS